jgi:glycosyltransferase involved in cell wall biosynthesis
VRIHETTGTPLGPAHNFARAIAATTGDIVVLCDQDDVWERERLSTTGRVLAEQPEAVALFSDATLIDDSSRPLGETLWEALGIAGHTARAFANGSRVDRVRILCEGNVVTGATLAMRSTAAANALPIAEGWLHDHWLAIVLAAQADMVMWTEPLCRYRIHDAQHTGVGTRRPPRWYFVRRRAQMSRRLHKNERVELRAQADGLGMILERLRAMADADPAALEFLASRKLHFEARAALGDGQRRPRVVARELVHRRYHRHSSGWSSVAKDLMLKDVR